MNVYRRFTICTRVLPKGVKDCQKGSLGSRMFQAQAAHMTWPTNKRLHNVHQLATKQPRLRTKCSCPKKKGKPWSTATEPQRHACRASIPTQWLPRTCPRLITGSYNENNAKLLKWYKYKRKNMYRFQSTSNLRCTLDMISLHLAICIRINMLHLTCE